MVLKTGALVSKTILDEPSRQLLWEQYLGDQPAFDAAGEARRIDGKRRRPDFQGPGPALTTKRGWLACGQPNGPRRWDGSTDGHFQAIATPHVQHRPSPSRSVPLPSIAIDAPGCALRGGNGRFEAICVGNRFARPVGFEPTTSGLEIRCSIQLSYGRN